jgi:hypothetical protein
MTGLITSRQAAAVLTARLGEKVDARLVGAMANRLQRYGVEVSAPVEESRGGWVSGDDLDRIEGELRQRRAGFENVLERTKHFEAAVETSDGRWVRMALPYRRTWQHTRQEWIEEIPSAIETYEWPTGERTGTLVHVGEDGEWVLYRWQRIEGD